jgi:hypothetical protein
MLGLALNLDPPNLYLLCSWDYRHEPPHQPKRPQTLTAESLRSPLATWGPICRTWSVSNISSSYCSCLNLISDHHLPILLDLWKNKATCKTQPNCHLSWGPSISSWGVCPRSGIFQQPSAGRLDTGFLSWLQMG